jgi:hypothetical protein
VWQSLSAWDVSRPLVTPAQPPWLLLAPPPVLLPPRPPPLEEPWRLPATLLASAATPMMWNSDC